MTNRKYLKENNLYESHKQFMRLCEWSYVPKSLEEDDEDEMPEDPLANMEEQPPTNSNDQPQMDGQEQNPMGNEEQPMGDDLEGQEGGLEDQGDDFDMDSEEIPPMEDEVDMGSDDEVIDVDDLTNAQEELNDKMISSTQELGQVDSKISSLLQAIDKMENMISNNNNQIQSLKSEFEKRNPTQTEKLNLRALDSYPYNVKVKDYWDEKSANSNYDAYGDNSESPTKEYKITNNDVDNFNDRQMNDSFNVNDDMEQDLKKIFNLK